jgi:hypothetical protein
MNGLASLLRYQMGGPIGYMSGGPIGYMSGGPIGYADGGDIEAIYKEIFKRDPDKEGLEFYKKELDGVPLSVAYDRIAGGAQGADAAALEANKAALLDKIVENIYREQLGRPADEAGKDFYVQQLASGKTATDLANEIDRTLEGYNFDAERIASNYRQEFGRNPDQEGFQYYMSQEDALVGKADDKAVTDAIRGGVKGVDVEALAAKPDTGYTQLQLEALGSDPYAGRYATVDPYYFDGVPDDAVNVSRNALDQSIQFTNPVYEQPIVSWFDQDKGFQTTAGEQGDFQQFQGLTGNNVLQREDVENAINLSLKSGALDEKTAANLRDRIDPDSDNKATSWDELYQILKEPKATVVLNAMGVQVGEDVSATEALKESNTRKQLANIAAENIEGNPSALYQFTLAENIANITGENVDDIYPFSSKNLGLGSIDTKKTTADVFNNVATELGIPADKKIVRAPTISTPATQRATPFTFAPLRRGLGQLRPAMSMTGLTSGQAAFGGVAPTPGQPLNNLPAPPPATPYALPEDFVLQTGAYNTRDSFPSAFTPFTSSPSTVAGNTAAGPAGVDQPTFAELVENVQRIGAQVETLSPANQSFYGSGGDGFSDGFGDPSAGESATSNDPSSGFTGSVSGVGSPGDDEGTGSPTGDFEVGGLIRMAEGGEPPTPPKMTELSDKDLGSTFDINDYIKEGILVGGMSKPIRDEYGKIIGYESGDLQGVSPEMPLLPLPIQRDVVFGELRDKEAAMRLTDAEREQMMVEMAMRQGRTGISPTTGGLAGIQIGDPEKLKRRQPQYYSTVEQFRPRYAEGGLANAAQNLAARGRYGDSTLVHMAPEELSGLQALARAQGNDMTINPRTGLPEAFSLKKLFKAASFILPFVPIPGLFGMSSLLTKSILSGVAAGASAKGGFDLKQALGGGLKAYALGSLGEKMGGGPTPGGGPTSQVTAPEAAAVDAAAVTAPTVTVPGVDRDISLAGSYTGPGSTPLGPQSLNANLTAPLKVGSSYGFQAATDVASAPIFEAPIGAAGGRDIPLTGGALPPGVDTVPGRMANVITPKGQGFGPEPLTKGFDIAATGLGGFSLEKAAEETRRADIEAAAVKQKEEERERLFEELARRTLGRVAVKSGGQINLAKGGMSYMEGGGTTDVTGEPRMVQGTGDGMSDSVPATIEGVQEARLANDEFVIPADVVADIGNGSSNAGAKKLYNMMDRIRKARHGTTKQPPEIRAERLMPA